MSSLVRDKKSTIVSYFVSLKIFFIFSESKKSQRTTLKESVIKCFLLPRFIIVTSKPSFKDSLRTAEPNVPVPPNSKIVFKDILFHNFIGVIPKFLQIKKEMKEKTFVELEGIEPSSKQGHIMLSTRLS